MCIRNELHELILTSILRRRKNEMDCLPNEMLERILYFVDGHSLVRAASVCTKWRAVASIFDKNTVHWKSICFEEISRSVLLELTLKMYPFWRPNSENDSMLKWKDLYLSWLQWKMLTNFTYHVDTLCEQKPCFVTCMKLAGDSVVVGLHNGEISTWKALAGDPFLISRHHSRVTCLDIVCILDERRTLVDERKKLYYVISTSHDRMVKMSLLIEKDMAPKTFDVCRSHFSTVMVRAQQSFFAILDDSGKISVFAVDAPKRDSMMPTVNLIAYYPTQELAILSLDLWGSLVTGMSRKGTLLRADFFDSENVMKVSPENGTIQVTVVETGISHLLQVYHNGLEISQCYSWRNEIYLWITENQKMLISLDGRSYYEYDPLKALNSQLRVAEVYGNLLFLGMESGSVYIYYFEALEDLLKLNLEYFQWQHPVSEKPIIGLDVFQSSSGPKLAVLSHSDIHMIEWPLIIDDFL